LECILRNHFYQLVVNVDCNRIISLDNGLSTAVLDLLSNLSSDRSGFVFLSDVRIDQHKDHPKGSKGNYFVYPVHDKSESIHSLGGILLGIEEA